MSKANKYWNNNGALQNVLDQLHKEIPRSGECPKTRPALERLRKATNCYYDLYNNGLCNRAAEFSKVFGMGGTRIAREGYVDEIAMGAVDAKLEKIIRAAAAEAGIKVSA